MKKFILFGLLITFISATPVWAVTTTPYDSAANLVSALLGPGIEVQNITYTGATVASGYFTGGAAAGIGINSGISLTSGYLTNVNGTVNNNDGITGNNGTPGSTQLNTIVSPQVTYDAVALSFQFKSIGDAAYFNYVFGSEEYNEFVDQYNDVFAFYLNGVNMALVPGTSQPVSINTVNKDDNAAFYNNNDPTSSPFTGSFKEIFKVMLMVKSMPIWKIKAVAWSPNSVFL